MKQRLLTFWILILAVSLASWKPKPQAKGQRVAQALAVAVADTDSIVRRTPVPLPKGDTARKYIKLLPGFEAVPQNGQFYVATIDTARWNNQVSSICDIRVQSLDLIGQERTVLKRGLNESFTLRPDAFNGALPANLTYSWRSQNGVLGSNSTQTISQIGEYFLTVSDATQTCAPVSVKITSTPCLLPNTNYNCGTNPNFTPVSDSPTDRLATLAVGDTVTAGDFLIEITRIFGGDATGGWYAVGAINAPFLQARIEVELKAATFNNCYQFTGFGSITTSYDASWANVVDIDVFKKNTSRSLIDFQDFLTVYQGDSSDVSRLDNFEATLIDVKQKIQESNSLTDSTKAQVSNNINLLQQKRQELEATPNLCSGINAPNGRISTALLVCPVAEMLAITTATLELINMAIPIAQCKSSGRASSLPLLTKGDFDPRTRKLQEGVVAHLILEWDYYFTHPTNQVELEYQIPEASTRKKGNIGYADIVNKTTGEIFEIKFVTDTSLAVGSKEVDEYVAKATQYCPNTPAWRRGMQYNDIANQRVFPWPFDKSLLLVANIPPAYLLRGGVISWYTKTRKNNPSLKTTPIFVPTGVFNKLKQLMQLCIEQPKQIEQLVTTFLQQNPEVVYYVQALALTAAVTIVIGTLVEDVLTGFVGVLDDLVCFEAAYTLYRVAKTLQVVARPAQGFIRPILTGL